MTLDTIANPRATGIEELVPSRYALKIGQIDVMVVSDGVLPLPTQTMSTNAEPAERAAWFKDQFLPPDAFDWGLNVMVVRSGAQTVLVDTGLGGQFPGFPRAGKTPSRLEAAGIDLAAITDIIITHMHMDHIGGLLVDGVKERLRPDVRIHIAATEVDFWKDPDFSRTDMPEPVPDVLRATAKEFMNRYGNNVQTFGEEHEVAPGVLAWRTGGHTPGHCVVRVTDGGDRLTFAGDAIFPVGVDHPDWHNGFEHDPEEAVQVRLRLLKDAAATRELLVSTHMPFPSLGRIAIDGEDYRWVANFWDY